MKTEKISELIETVHRLRAPDGCPWDRAQTHQTLRPYLIEEAYEVLDVLDQVKTAEDLKNPKILAPFKEEMGDLLMQVMLHSELASEVGAFNFSDVAETLNEKLIRRHPHVFGDMEKADSAETAFQNWEKQKAKEKSSNPEASILDGLPKGLPALQRAGRMIEKVTKVGFQWSDMEGPLAKVDEELEEFKNEVRAFEKAGVDQAGAPLKEALREKIAGELGDLLFTLCNVGHLLKITPEDALRSTLSKFERRFKYVEQSLKKIGKTPEQSDLAEMDRYWDEAKKAERA